VCKAIYTFPSIICIKIQATKSVAHTTKRIGAESITINNNFAPFRYFKKDLSPLKKVMKTKNRQLLALSAALILALSIGVTSCKKDKDEAKPLTATANGAGFDPLYVTAVANQGDIHIEGTSKDSSYLIVSFSDTAKVNTAYTFDAAGVFYFDAKKNASYTYWTSSAHGTVTVSTFDKTNKKVAGKFTGVLYNWNGTNDSVSITNGQFNTTYQ
jgi:hypothetical protein